jgi:hypothetical protein
VVCFIPEVFGSVQGHDQKEKYTGIMLYQSRALCFSNVKRFIEMREKNSLTSKKI